MKTVHEILAKKPLHFNYVSPDSKVIDAIALMKIEDMSHVVVMKDHNYLGILTEKDYAQKIILQNRNSATTQVKEIMTVDLPVISVEDSADKCMEMMHTFKVRYLPVFDGHKYLAVITINDLLQASVEDQKAPVTGHQYTKNASQQAGQTQHYWI